MGERLHGATQAQQTLPQEKAAMTMVRDKREIHIRD
jgi:hypothetical protein